LFAAGRIVRQEGDCHIAALRRGYEDVWLAHDRAHGYGGEIANAK
jgi:hypothetical protein